MEHASHFLRLGVVILVLALAAAPAFARDEPGKPAITWLWSATSAPVAKSTAALATGRTSRAIWLGAMALETVTGAERAIVVHNLCLAWLNSRDESAAAPHCAAALTAVRSESALNAWERATIRANIGEARRQFESEGWLRIAAQTPCD